MYSVQSFGVRSLVVVGSGFCVVGAGDVFGSVEGAGVVVVMNQSPQMGAVPLHIGFSGSYVSPVAKISFTFYK